MATAVPALAATAAARRHIVASFTEEGATDPARAILLPEPVRHLQRKVLALFREQDIVRETGDGRYWLDEPKLARYIARRRLRAITFIGIATAGSLALAAAATIAFGVGMGAG